MNINVISKYKERNDNMNSLQKQDEIKDLLTERESVNIKKFLDFFQKYTLEDIYFNPQVRREFKVWQYRQEYSHLTYYVEGLNRNNPFIKVTLDDMMQELESNPKLKEHVLIFAKKEFEENHMMDKHVTIHAIETGNIDILYNHDTEVRENFCKSFLGGIKTRKIELHDEIKYLKDKHEKEQSR